ncbi:MAG: NAD(+) synthase [Candidatus Thermoplasmatota archaeon]|nr:NAD(+) synthase [Candidatus Thermoplasmatota archaeon]MCL5730757.1 NAD(+) synthase [Candidatus Thermoplasmatota archaeon]
MSSLKPEIMFSNITDFIREVTAGREMILGTSSGVDSSLVLMLSVSVDRKRVHPFFLYDRATPDSDFNDIDLLERKAGVTIERINIEPIERSFSGTVVTDSDPRIFGNVKARIRMTILYYFSNLYSGMVLGTTNRTEYMLGYFTKYGDGACDVEPIMHLHKNEVRILAEFAGVPESIIRKKPTAGLWEGQTDEGEIGISYDEIDRQLKSIESSAEGKNVSKRILEMIASSEHKRRMPPSLLDK